MRDAWSPEINKVAIRTERTRTNQPDCPGRPWGFLETRHVGWPLIHWWLCHDVFFTSTLIHNVMMQHPLIIMMCVRWWSHHDIDQCIVHCGSYSKRREGKHIGGVSSVDLPTLVDPDFSSVLIHFSASSSAGMLAYRSDIMCPPLSLQTVLDSRITISIFRFYQSS